MLCYIIYVFTYYYSYYPPTLLLLPPISEDQEPLPRVPARHCRRVCCCAVHHCLCLFTVHGTVLIIHSTSALLTVIIITTTTIIIIIASMTTTTTTSITTTTTATTFSWDRVFCYRSERWGNTGVASLAPSADSYTLGAAALLTDKELAYLDAFEIPAYRRQHISITVLQKDGEEISVTAIAYIAIHPLWLAPPSEQYLTAIHFMLREQWGHIHPRLDISIKGNILYIDIDISSIALHSIVLHSRITIVFAIFLIYV
jgi:hypothetical protein